MKNKHKQILLFIADIIIVIISYWIAAYLRYDFIIPEVAIPVIWLCIVISLPGVIALNIILGSYKDLFRYVGIEALFKQGITAFVSVGILLVVMYYRNSDISGSVTVIYGVILFVLTSGVRIVPRSFIWFKSTFSSRTGYSRRAVIVGAGNTGAMLIKNARNTQAKDNFLPVAIVDNDANKHGLTTSGVKVVGNIDSIKEVCETYRATEIIVALPNATKDQLYEIYKKCITVNLPIKSSQNLADVKDSLHEDNIALRSVTIEDLLFRDIIENDMSAVLEFLNNRVVMITGGAGSIGSELCKQALEYGCKQLIIYDFNENGLYDIDEIFSELYDRNKYTLCLGSIRDKSRLDEVIRQYKPYIVFHAAAHKHVPMLEINPFEAVKNNVIGTMNVVETCIKNKVNKFILISTDKAVNPVNMLGATKRMAEMIVENMTGNGTQLAAVRFGNVLGSIGSVIPKFKKQILNGGPVTVTHKDIVRFFMTVSEAVNLVLTAGTLAKDGEIFILDMGQPVRIYNLAEDLIRLSGYEPNVDIDISIIGLRQGEKLYEDLYTTDERIDATSHEKIFILGKNITNSKYNFRKAYDNICKLVNETEDKEILRKKLFEIIQCEG